MHNLNVTQRLGDIVAFLPGASDVFKKYNIDFCCGGDRLLETAIKEQDLDEQVVMGELNEKYEQAKKVTNQVDFRSLSKSQLIDYIVNKHHTLVKRILPEISELTTTILRVHGPNHRDLYKVHKLFHNLKTELDQHLITEEEILFPMIKEFDLKPTKELLDQINSVMGETEEEHEAAGDVLKELRKITSNYQVPADGCGTYSLTYEKMQELEADLFEHIHLENNILFHQFEFEL